MRRRWRNCCTFPPLLTELPLQEELQIVTIHQDLVTYEVIEITPCLRVREAVEGSGSCPPLKKLLGLKPDHKIGQQVVNAARLQSTGRLWGG